MNHLAASTEDQGALNQVYNVACGDRTSLIDLVSSLQNAVSRFDPEIEKVIILHGPTRQGDVKDSLADISKAKTLLGYEPSY